MLRKIIRVCLTCKKTFRLRSLGQTYCSKPCRPTNRYAKKIFPKKECSICGTTFQPKLTSHRLCSKDCRRAWSLKHYGRAMAREPGVSSCDVGAAAELVVSAELLVQGFDVFRSVSPNSCCDIIAMKDGVTRMIEVRRGRRDGNGSLFYPKRHSPFATEFAVIIWEPREIVYVPIVKTG